MKGCRMRVLMISKACVTASYRSKLVHLNKFDDLSMGLVVPDRWDNLPYEADPTDSTYPIYKGPIPFNGKNHFHWYPELSRYVADFKPDLIHIDEEHYSYVTARAAALGRRLGIPTIFFTWQNIYKDYPWPFSAIERGVFKRTGAAIAGNREAETVLRKKGYDKSVAVIPQFGTDLTLFGPRDRQAIHESYGVHTEFTVGYVGRLIEEKGIGDLLQAMAPLMHEDSSVGLVIVGRGPYQDEVKAWQQRESVADRVVDVPWVSSDAMGDVMNLMDVLVLPSHTTNRWKEQFGRVLTEAMASGDVVVGSDSGEIPHVIGDAGLVYHEGDAPGLEQALRKLRGDPVLFDNLAQRGIRRVADHFTQEAIAQKTHDFYRLVLGG